ncbi:MAG: DUF4156 domain-containing protein [Myxococcota bacterium]
MAPVSSRYLKHLGGWVLCLGLSGCLSLSEDARRVRVFPSAEHVGTCKYLGEVRGDSAQWGSNGRERAEIDLRNDAAQLGGDSVVVKSDQGLLAWKLTADVFRCSGVHLSTQRGQGRSSMQLKKPTRILVMDLKVLDVKANIGRIVTQLLTSQLEAVGNLSTVGRADIDAALDTEKQRDLLGCDDASCLAEIGGALGTGVVLYGSIGPIGSQYAMNLSLFDVQRAKTLARVSRTLPKDEDALVAAVPELVEELVSRLE